jgi:hypothetical protein
MPPTANVFWSESLPPQMSLGKDAGCCRELVVIGIVTRPLQYIDIVQLPLQSPSETDSGSKARGRIQTWLAEKC